ncbi:hypothetical protein TW95_gp1233 [Pandoravirus inopinatum]|uniref:Uncharacterized protein n=1 Tax=Pandoravirus inopinatum TaxID=1605721 RepID=A0A0B5JDY2_9VIRU|nr:hypothetical protein TW95_gp1233 [Pandoravirus inopinatum]AJF97967.1 hypothetical protein [Pandoravirus inopinatum]
MASATPTTAAAGADDPSTAFVVLVDGACAYALTRLMVAVKHSDALATVHPDGRIVFSGGRHQIFNDTHWWCSVRARHQGPPIRAPLSFVVNIGELGRWFGTCSPLMANPDLVLRYPASPGRTEVGFESWQRGARHAATLVGISRAAMDHDDAAFFADAALPSAAHAIAAPLSMRAQLLYASCRADWIFVYPEAVVVDATAAAIVNGNASDGAALWPSRWVMAAQRESDHFLLFHDHGARAVDAPALDGVNGNIGHTGQPVGCGSRKRRRRRRHRMTGCDTYVRALLTLPAELRYAIVELLVRAWMPTVAATSCLADLTSWMSVHAPVGRIWAEFRRACRKVYAERAAAYTVRRRIGPALQLHKSDLSSLHACSSVFRLNATDDSPDLWPEPRLSLWRPGVQPVFSVAGESHAKAGRDSHFCFCVAYTAKST